MTYLEIKDNKGYFKTKSKVQTPIDQISKEDLLELLDLAVEDDDFEMTEFDKEILLNQAHQIIYGDLYRKFEELRQQRTMFRDEALNLYKESFAKYSVEPTDGVKQKKKSRSTTNG
jgi:hypothetical protein